MKYFHMEPEVAGGLGEGTVMDRSVHPPTVSELNYEFDDWPGDAILEGFPAFVVTEVAAQALRAVGATGVDFGDVEVTVSGLHEDLNPGGVLPAFVWLKPVGRAGEDDFGVGSDLRLVISGRALDVLKGLGFANADIEPFDR